jgi:hypothetical protein
MEPSTGFRAKGSFGVPQEMQKDLEDARRKAANKGAPPEASSMQPHAANRPPMSSDVPAAPQAPGQPAAPPTAEETAEAVQEAKFKELKESIEKRLETTITPEDIKDYIFKGSLTKTVSVIPGVFKCAFKTLTPTEYFEIDTREAAFRDEGKYTLDGIMNQRAIVTLSYAWIAADGKPLSAKNDPALREKNIRVLGSHVVEFAVSANQDFNTLLKLVLQEKAFIKKS